VSDVEIRDIEGGITLAVAVHPRARGDAIRGAHGGALRIDCVAAPERGAANEAVQRLLARAFRVSRDAVELAAGAASRRKRFRVAGLDAATARARLAAGIGTADRRPERRE
jgi:uncharacterized protein YggU (UPF0235/DUF167 family)